MRAIHPDPRHMLLAGLAALALTLATLTFPSRLGDASLTFPGLERASAPAQVVVDGSRSRPLSDPLDSPLMHWLRTDRSSAR